MDFIPTVTTPPTLVPQNRALTSEFHRQKEYKSTDDPDHALQDPRVANVFRHYINHLAGWYDLNDNRRHFKDAVPVRARRNPLLLSAILAFAAANLNRTLAESDYLEFAEYYHYDSVRRLISLTGNVDERPIGETLAAICLLRSYEIITREYYSMSIVRLNASGSPFSYQKMSALRVTSKDAIQS